MLRDNLKWVDRILVLLYIFLIVLSSWVIVGTYHLSQYDVNTNNCVHQSSAIVKWCSEHGIDAKLVYGDLYQDGKWSAHVWVQFFGFYDFEATNWFPCDMGKYKIVYYQRYDSNIGKFVSA